MLHISDELKKVFQLMNECDIPDMFEQQRKLEMLLERLMEFGTSDILRGKHVVSLGGRFSAGKSKFINAITIFYQLIKILQHQYLHILRKPILIKYKPILNLGIL